MKLVIVEIALVLVFLSSVNLISALSSSSQEISSGYEKLILGEDNLRPWTSGYLQLAEAPGPANGRPAGTLVLAAKSTNRPDILNGFKHYRGGWNITNRHYWASVGFTGSAGFILALLWFVSFGLVLVVQHCCRWKIHIKGKEIHLPHMICLILLLLFTCAAAVGCILLSVGQDEFHDKVFDMLKYVVNQSEYTVQTLRNVTDFLSLAKSIDVDQVFLPSNVKNEIDTLNADLNNAANTLTKKTSENSGKIRKVFNAIRSALITVAAVMLILTLLGLLLSVLGHQHAIYIFILSGWILVAITFILCGLFVILNHAISDTCEAMGEWVDNPQAETALSSILPCVDQETTNKTLFRSKEVIGQLVTVVNTVIYTFANINPPPQATPFYFNQSGPLIPPLCSPFDSELHDRPCGSIEVSIANASLEWRKYICTVSASGFCTNVGRLTPDLYNQLMVPVNVSYALDHYAPPLLNFQDCSFVRDTFNHITSDYCPPVEHFLKITNAGLGLIAVGVLLCLVLWILNANSPRREEVFVRKFLAINRKAKHLLYLAIPSQLQLVRDPSTDPVTAVCSSVSFGILVILTRTNSVESRIRQAIKEALRESHIAGNVCVCRSPAAGGCRNCLRIDISERLRNVGFNRAICKSKWRSSPEIPFGIKP
ncbi:hypothetical protein NE237_020649 [Protea cynaroides]|uniref:Transmembrane protein n=1 Tax=Protea cynaroides TaxID=273540 RepID=A0A9Q0K1V6_9MAGN|nr:hypothetical protein NE237_020649 [Protea cynaroides]